MTAQAGDTFEYKRALRRDLRRQRAAVCGDRRHLAARDAAAHLLRSRIWRRARHIALYLEHGSELSTARVRALAWAQGKRLYVPRIGRDHRMHFVEITTHTRLRCNRHGIREPLARAPLRPLRRLDLVLLPLLGFDAQGHRLGSGGGYYDRLLANRLLHHPLCLGWALALQQVAALPRDPWDHRMDGIVTERGILRARNTAPNHP